LGGFNLPLKVGERVRLIRAFNILRQYEEKDFAPAHERLAQYVLPGGLMIEGTSNPFGSIWCANVVRRTDTKRVILSEAKNLEFQPVKTLRSWREERHSLRVTSDWRFEALVFSTNSHTGFDITDFQAVLPKNLIHHVLPGDRFMISSRHGRDPRRRLRR
jgi:hypothetical protein